MANEFLGGTDKASCDRRAACGTLPPRSALRRCKPCIAVRLRGAHTDAAVFERYRELIEQVASDAYDAEGPFDDHGRILVTSEALARVTRSA
jgi:hypothetical protein